jgi:hypothetical protein
VSRIFEKQSRSHEASCVESRATAYKRNQVEEAIARILNPDSPAPSVEFRTRVKRLLELDRSLGRNRASRNAEEANFAFFTDEAPGRGADILFSEYEAFALLNGLVILQHGWTQGFAVSLLRRLRIDLEREHQRTLLQDPVALFDQEAIRAKAKPGELYFGNADPVLVVITSKLERARDKENAPACAVCHGLQAMTEFIREMKGENTSMWDVVNNAHKLRQELTRTRPRRRGR